MTAREFVSQAPLITTSRCLSRSLINLFLQLFCLTLKTRAVEKQNITDGTCVIIDVIAVFIEQGNNSI